MILSAKIHFDMQKGFFITIYGVNNIGKSTQAKLLVERLCALGLDAVLLKYPIYDLEPTGPKINKILRSDQAQKISEEELQSLFMENRRDFEPELRRMLAKGKIVVAEDYTGTGIGWGTAKGADMNWLIELNKNLVQEDLAILLVGKRNVQAREQKHLHEKDDELVKKVGKILLNLGEKFGWVKVEVLTDNVPGTTDKIWEVVKNRLNRK